MPKSVKNSVDSAGFHPDYTQWHVAKHDVYGERFREAWNAAAGSEVNEEMLEVDAQVDNMVINDN